MSTIVFLGHLHELVEQKQVDLVVLTAHGHSCHSQWPYSALVNSFITYGATSLLILQVLPSNEIRRAMVEHSGRRFEHANQKSEWRGRTERPCSLRNLMLHRQPNSVPDHGDQLRASPPETTSRLERMAHQLAAQHVIGPQPAGHARHLTHLSRLTQQLQDAHQHLVTAPAQDLAHSSAAEWLLDNYYLVVQALRQIEEDLPESYYHQLPKLDRGRLLSGYPHAPDSRASTPRRLPFGLTKRINSIKAD